MLKINKRNIDITSLLKEKYQQTSIEFYFGTKVKQNGSDDYEMVYDTSLLNSRILKEAFTREIEAEKLVWKQYGLKELGAIEVLCDGRYESWFRNSDKTVINNREYEIFKSAASDRVLIQKRPFNMIRIIMRLK